MLHDSCFLSDVNAPEAQRLRLAQIKVQRRLAVACCLSFSFMVAEVVGGYYSHSVAVMSDAAHLLSDVTSFAVSLFAAWAVTQKSPAHYSFGCVPAP